LKSHFHVIDIDANKKTTSERKPGEFASLSSHDGVTAPQQRGAASVLVGKPAPVRILTPVQREMDKAIWTAFQFGTFHGIWKLLSTRSAPVGSSTQPPHSQLVNYARSAADGTTALMAAAHRVRPTSYDSVPHAACAFVATISLCHVCCFWLSELLCVVLLYIVSLHAVLLHAVLLRAVLIHCCVLALCCTSLHRCRAILMAASCTIHAPHAVGLYRTITVMSAWCKSPPIFVGQF
jgi:hypothetical protein